MNFFDKLFINIAPQFALKRMVAKKKLNAINSGYSQYGASRSNKAFAGWSYQGGSADDDIHDSLPVLRQRCRDLYMGVALACGAVKVMRTNVIGTGLVLKSQIDHDVLGISQEDAQALEDVIEREFALWAESELCDAARLDNFYDLQQLVFLNWLMSGDVIATLPTSKKVNAPYDLCINLIEADRVCNPIDEEFNPKIVGGIETNSNGEVIAYHIARHHPLTKQYTEQQKWDRVEAFGAKTGRRNILHIMNRERVGQRRGVPFLAPVIEALKQLGRYMDAELDAAIVNGIFAIFIQKKAPSDDAPLGNVSLSDQYIAGGGDMSQLDQLSSKLTSGKLDENVLHAGKGSMIDLDEGEEAHSETPGRPNANYGDFVAQICKMIGVALEIPYEVLMKEFHSSYSASRAAIIEFRKTVDMFRGWFVEDFCKPVFQEWLSEAVAKGRISAPGFFNDPIIRKAYCGAEWQGPAQASLDPKKEAEAAVIRIANGLSTRDREAQELTGSDFYSNMAQRKREEELLREVNCIGQSEDK